MHSFRFQSRAERAKSTPPRTLSHFGFWKYEKWTVLASKWLQARGSSSKAGGASSQAGGASSQAGGGRILPSRGGILNVFGNCQRANEIGGGRLFGRNMPRDAQSAPSASLAADPHPYSCLASAQIAIKNSSLRVPLRRVPKKCQIKSPYLGKAFIFIASSFTSYTFLFSYRLFLYFCIFMPYTFIS